MPFRASKMKGFILGFHRWVRCPKCAPASNSSLPISSLPYVSCSSSRPGPVPGRDFRFYGMVSAAMPPEAAFTPSLLKEAELLSLLDPVSLASAKHASRHRELTQMKRHRGRWWGGGHSGSLPHNCRHRRDVVSNEPIEPVRVPCGGPAAVRGARAGKAAGRLLDEVCAVCGVSRKHAIKLMGGQMGWGHRDRGGAGPAAKYGPEEPRVLKAIWFAAEQPCGKRLAAALPLWLPHYEAAVGRLDAGLRDGSWP